MNKSANKTYRKYGVVRTKVLYGMVVDLRPKFVCTGIKLGKPVGIKRRVKDILKSKETVPRLAQSARV